MPIKVRCTGCEKVLSVADGARGKAVTCPNCQTRVAVPREGAKQATTKNSAKPSSDVVNKKSASKSVKPPDSESELIAFDLTRSADANARICVKCGFDMKHLEAEESECPECGFCAESGGLGKQARKRMMIGPDPADFYVKLCAKSWRFVKKNQQVAWRTTAYLSICLLLASVCGYLFLWIAAWPPRAFFGICFVVLLMVMPGWLWFLNVEVIKLTLEGKDKIKRLNFDFFLSSALGLLAVGWFLAISLPLIVLPLGIDYFLVNFLNRTPWIYAVCVAVGVIPVLVMLPVAMSHMVMPISVRGWLIWKIFPVAVKNIKPLLLMLLWLFVSTLPVTGGATVIGVVWGRAVYKIGSTMESNGRTLRIKIAEESKSSSAKNQSSPSAAAMQEIETINFQPLIGPVMILALMLLPTGLMALFNMRINGEFTYYFRNRLDLIERRKERKYVAKKKVDEEEEDEKPRTLKTDLTEALVASSLCLVLGTIFGMIYGTLTPYGNVAGIILGLFWGSVFACVVGKMTMSSAAWETSVGWGLSVRFLPFTEIAFAIKYWTESRKGFFISALSGPVTIVILILASVGVLNFGFLGLAKETVVPTPQPVQPVPGLTPESPAADAAPIAPAILHGVDRRATPQRRTVVDVLDEDSLLHRDKKSFTISDRGHSGQDSAAV